MGDSKLEPREEAAPRPGGLQGEDLIEMAAGGSLLNVKGERAGIAPLRTMPKQKPGRSKQDYGTPRVFLDAVERHFGPITLDLAAHSGNHVCGDYYGEGGIAPDSLKERWVCPENAWLNPPFGDIEPWAMKCYETTLEAKALMLGFGRILFLVPASIGSNWFAQYVYNCARVYALQGRLSFDGIAPYPKDCMLCVYGETPGFEVWDWRRS